MSNRSAFRGVRPPQKHKRGVYGETRVLWTNLGRMDFSMHQSVEEDDFADGHLPSKTIVLHATNMRGGVAIDLTDMTEQELLSVRKFFLEAIDDALPSVRELDRHAKEMHGNGDHYYPRVYRQLPVYVDLRGEKLEHGEGVPFRPGPTRGSDDAADQPRRLREGMRRVPDEVPIHVVAEDDEATNDDDPYIWQVPRL